MRELLSCIDALKQVFLDGNADENKNITHWIFLEAESMMNEKALVHSLFRFAFLAHSHFRTFSDTTLNA
jgi:hypothetical protein